MDQDCSEQEEPSSGTKKQSNQRANKQKPQTKTTTTMLLGCPSRILKPPLTVARRASLKWTDFQGDYPIIFYRG
jgi:hypothetical protein